MAPAKRAGDAADDDHNDPPDPQRRLGLLGHHAHERARRHRRRLDDRVGGHRPSNQLLARGRRDFLDSRHGRHFADDVASGLACGLPLREAVDAAVTRWIGWRISRSMSRETGIPHGLPYLTGLVADYAIVAELPY